MGAVRLSGEHKYQDQLGETVPKSVSAFSSAAGVHGGGLFSVGTRILLGFEVSLGSAFSNANMSIEDSNGGLSGQLTVKRGSNIGFAIVLGIPLNPKVLGYAKLGLDVTSYELNYSALNFGNKTALTYKKSMSSIVPAVGVLYFITKNISLGLEYQPALLYKKFMPRRITENVFGAYRGFIFRPREHRVFIKANYHF